MLYQFVQFALYLRYYFVLVLMTNHTNMSKYTLIFSYKPHFYNTPLEYIFPMTDC